MCNFRPIGVGSHYTRSCCAQMVCFILEVFLEVIAARKVGYYVYAKLLKSVQIFYLDIYIYIPLRFWVLCLVCLCPCESVRRGGGAVGPRTPQIFVGLLKISIAAPPNILSL